jgi:hypothetical protein
VLLCITHLIIGLQVHGWTAFGEHKVRAFEQDYMQLHFFQKRARGSPERKAIADLEFSHLKELVKCYDGPPPKDEPLFDLFFMNVQISVACLHLKVRYFSSHLQNLLTSWFAFLDKNNRSVATTLNDNHIVLKPSVF